MLLTWEKLNGIFFMQWEIATHKSGGFRWDRLGGTIAAYYAKLGKAFAN